MIKRNKNSEKGSPGPDPPTHPIKRKEGAVPPLEPIVNPKDRKEQTAADTDHHNGSGGAFEATEEGGDEADDTR